VKKFEIPTRGSKRRPRSSTRPQEEGYILLTLLLVIALMAILTIGVIIPMKFEMQRDQEQEMIHRGVQYSRAIRGYYKKFGRYPTRLEDLENTNNLRYLRKRYKDPLNKNQDFRLLHFGDPGVTLGGGLSIGGGSIPGATPAGSPSGTNTGAGNSAFGNSAFGGGAGSSAFGGSSGVNSSGVFSQSSSGFGNSNSSFGANSNSQTSSSQQQEPNAVPGADPTQDPSAQGQGTGPQGATSSGGQQPFGGGAIVGVASVNKNTTIREFNHKKKYNEWQFVYDPASDRGGLITTPNQPALQGFGAQPALNGAQPTGAPSSAFGNSNGSSFGQSSGFGNNGSQNGSSPPVQQPSAPQQQ
jgi:type II secretory pathway pseudopilin PulG